MKSALVGLLIVIFSSSAFAHCTDYWGNRAYVKHIAENVIALQFDTYLYPYTGHLSYSGQRSTSFYFRGNGKTVEIEKSVFNTGKGRIWYHYKTQDGDRGGNHKSVTFTCR